MKQLQKEISQYLRLPQQYWQAFVFKFKHAAENNYNLACNFAERGMVSDAIVRFRIATWLKPDMYKAWYNMGCCLLAAGKQDKAIKAFKQCLLYKKNHEDALFMIASVNPALLPEAMQPKTMPLSLATTHFEALAPNYDEVQTGMYGYQAHKAMANMLSSVLESGRTNYQILELGCGSGLAGPLLRPFAETLVGVDISPSMLMRAGQVKSDNARPIYDTLKNNDMRRYLQECDAESFDVIVAVNALNYVGDLAPVFDGAKRALRPGGIFAFSTDIVRDPGTYRLIPVAARFGHSPEYLQAQAARADFVEIQREDIRAYPDYIMQQLAYKKP